MFALAGYHAVVCGAFIGFGDRTWNLIVSFSDHFLLLYFFMLFSNHNSRSWCLLPNGVPLCSFQLVISSPRPRISVYTMFFSIAHPL